MSKVFRFAASRELELNLDVYNIGNINTVWEVRTLTGRINLRYAGDPTGELINQQQYMSPTQIIAPRIMRLGVAFRF